jgi:ABC-type phosphate transport system substrate-binding protein
MRFPRRRARFLVYLLVVVVLFLARGGIRWNDLLPGAPGGSGDSLIVSGRDLAPGLIDRLTGFYGREYPELKVRVLGGGTNRALEDLINRRADVAFLARPPGAEEQLLFRSVDGDSALWFAVALGGIAVLAGVDADPDPVTRADLQGLLDGRSPGRFERLYVPDPNLGLWDALKVSLEMPPRDPEAGGRVVFLRDETGIRAAVRAEPGALGVVSTLTVPETLPPGVSIVPVGTTGEETILPAYETIASGEYPLIHTLYAACRSRGDIQGAKFVTFLTSGPGQRQIERVGVVPALLYLREVVLTRHPIGN